MSENDGFALLLLLCRIFVVCIMCSLRYTAIGRGRGGWAAALSICCGWWWRSDIVRVVIAVRIMICCWTSRRGPGSSSESSSEPESMVSNDRDRL